MKRKTNLWAWIVFACLLGALAAGCNVAKGYVGLPPMDGNLDGALDPEWIAAVNERKTAIDTATGGALSPWLAFATALAGLAASVYVKIKGDRDHAESVASIESLKSPQ